MQEHVVSPCRYLRLRVRGFPFGQHHADQPRGVLKENTEELCEEIWQTGGVHSGRAAFIMNDGTWPVGVARGGRGDG